MTTTTPTFDATAIGRWGESTQFEVTRERLVAYAEATNDPIASHRNGDVAPPVFAIVPIFDSLVEAALEVAPLELIPRLVHGEQNFRFHQAIRPGDVLTARAKAIGYEGKPNGTRGTVYAETRNADGDLLNEQWVTFFFRGFDVGEVVGELGPKHSFDERLRSNTPVANVLQHVDDDQTFRYSPAAGDPMPIHLDDEIARSAGLPGIIAHGLCTMAFTSWAVLTEVGDGQSERLKQLAVRFAKPVLPGQDLGTRIWEKSTSVEGTTYAFETTAAGEVVVKDGFAVIAD